MRCEEAQKKKKGGETSEHRLPSLGEKEEKKKPGTRLVVSSFRKEGGRPGERKRGKKKKREILEPHRGFGPGTGKGSLEKERKGERSPAGPVRLFRSEKKRSGKEGKGEGKGGKKRGEKG